MISRLILNVTLALAFFPAAFAASRLTNVSVRSTAGAGAETLIVGFAISGTGTKPLLVRGIGPSLSQFNVAGVVVDPQLRLFQGSELIAQNDDWGGGSLAAAFSAVGAFPLATTSRDAALLTPFGPGSFSAHLTTAGATGIGLVECYDTEALSAPARISNLSARSAVGTGAGVLTVGFSISGDTAKSVLIRGIGPTLTSFGVNGVLADPQLRVFTASGVELTLNDNWSGALGLSSAASAVGAFALSSTSRDAAVRIGLPPGSYTAQVSGVNNTTGNALVEVYELADPLIDTLTLQPVSNSTPAPAADIAPRLDTTPRVIFQARPTYPFEMRRAGIVGEALVLFTVKTDGTTADLLVTRASDISFANSAVAAVSQWRFTPGTVAGQPAASRLTVPIIFTLNEL